MYKYDMGKYQVCAIFRQNEQGVLDILHEPLEALSEHSLIMVLTKHDQAEFRVINNVRSNDMFDSVRVSFDTNSPHCPKPGNGIYAYCRNQPHAALLYRVDKVDGDDYWVADVTPYEGTQNGVIACNTVEL